MQRHSFMGFRSLLSLSALLLAGLSAQDPSPNLIGVWRGDSLCQVKASACHDEKALYRVKAAEDVPHHLAVTFSKIVDGREVVLGTIGDCRTKGDHHTIECNYERGTWLLSVSGDRMEGTLTLTDGTVSRRVNLTKQ